VPVTDPVAAAQWYVDAFGFRTVSVSEWSANLVGDQPRTTLTLMGPKSRIHAEPGLPFWTHSLNVDNLEATRQRLPTPGGARRRQAESRTLRCAVSAQSLQGTLEIGSYQTA
jgi:hypothetical protein